MMLFKKDEGDSKNYDCHTDHLNSDVYMFR